jgi:DNA-binding PadR family transcriptional regulator
MRDLLVLANLLPGPQYGYRLKKRAGLLFGDRELHNNVVYPVLHGAEKQRWVARKVVPGRGGQKRIQYALTPLGKAGLIRRISSFTEKEAASDEAFFLRVGLFAVLPREVQKTVLDCRELVVSKLEQRFRALRSELDPPGMGREVLAFLHARAKQELAWIKRLRGQCGATKPAGKAGAKPRMGR